MENNIPEFYNRHLLTRSQIVYILLFCKGLTEKEVANKVFRTPNTVNWNMAEIKKKCGFKTKTDLIRYGITEIENKMYFGSNTNDLID